MAMSIYCTESPLTSLGVQISDFGMARDFGGGRVGGGDDGDDDDPPAQGIYRRYEYSMQSVASIVSKR